MNNNDPYKPLHQIIETPQPKESDWEYYRWAEEQAQIRQKERVKKWGKKRKPFYDPINHHLHFNGQVIVVPSNTDQDALCRVLFQNEESVIKEWNWDEIMEEWRSEIKTDSKDIEKQQRKVYSAAREINQKIAMKTTVEDFLKITMLTVAINSKYLQQTS